MSGKKLIKWQISTMQNAYKWLFIFDIIIFRCTLRNNAWCEWGSGLILTLKSKKIPCSMTLNKWLFKRDLLEFQPLPLYLILNLLLDNRTWRLSERQERQSPYLGIDFRSRADKTEVEVKKEWTWRKKEYMVSSEDLWSLKEGRGFKYTLSISRQLEFAYHK